MNEYITCHNAEPPKCPACESTTDLRRTGRCLYSLPPWHGYSCSCGNRFWVSFPDTEGVKILTEDEATAKYPGLYRNLGGEKE